jgi:predicted XRE-type DNA-binding protein
MSFPSPEQLKKVLKDLESAEPTLVIDLKNASHSDVFKYKLCQEFVRYLKAENITQVELARRLDVDKSIVNKIILHRIETFTMDRLVDLLAKIKPIDFTFKAS